jgi:hypothetical protein
MFSPSNSVVFHYFSVSVEIKLCVDVDFQIFDNPAGN